MTRPLTRVATKAHQPSHNETKCAIAAQVEDFLKLGGTIQHIPNGVSGQLWKPLKQMTLSSGANAAEKIGAKK